MTGRGTPTTPGEVFIESEFVRIPSGQELTGACGLNAGAMAESWASQQYRGQTTVPGHSATAQFYLRARAAGRCGSLGVSNGGQVAAQLVADGYTIRRLPYREPMPQGTWLAFVRDAFAGRTPGFGGRPAVVVTEISYGGRLHDAISGLGEDAGAGLRYHFIVLVEEHPGGESARAITQTGGRVRTLPPGLWCADGDNWSANPIVHGHVTRVIAGHKLQFYPLDVLAAAQPCDLIAVRSNVFASPVWPATHPAPTPAPKPPAPAPAPHPAPAPAPPGAPLPEALSGWHDDGKRLVCWNGIAVLDREYVLAQARAGHWDRVDVPLEAPRQVMQVERAHPSHGPGEVQTFHLRRLARTAKEPTYTIWIGDELRHAEAAAGY